MAWEGQHEQSRPPVLAALRVAHHGSTAVIDLSFFSRRSEDDAHRLGRLRSAELAHLCGDGIYVARRRERWYFVLFSDFKRHITETLGGRVRTLWV